MAHPTLDLPDPLDSSDDMSSDGISLDRIAPDSISPDSISLGRAEDLLSQLAGDEIDRLMTEPAVRFDAPGSRGLREPRVISREPAHSAVHPSARSTAPIAPVARAMESDQEIVSVSPAELQALSAQLGSFFDAVDEGLLSPALPSSHFEERLASEEVTIEITRRNDRPLDEFSPEYRPARQVRAALTAPFDPEPTPTYLRPLDWLANPIASLSASARRAVGALAVASFLSAACLLAYVLMLRNG